MTSEPSTPTSTIPKDRAKWRFEEITTPTEWIECYRPSRLQPVHIGDEFRNGRYKVLRKLGYGSFSTVWLARDQESVQYVALKLLDARSSQSSEEVKMLQTLAQATCSPPAGKRIIELLDTFEHTGPNGTHLCMVLEPMGPSAASMVEEQVLGKFNPRSRYPAWIANGILKQALQGLAFLHQNGIAHADVQPGNMLFCLDDLAQVPAEALLQPDHGEKSVSEPVRRRDGKTDKWAPRYLAVAQCLRPYVTLEPGFGVKISDLGAAFYIDNLPVETVTPLGLRAPELIFHDQISEAIDIWSFGCLVFEFLTRQPLFPTYVEHDDEHLIELFVAFGGLPPNILARWENADRYVSSSGKLVNVNVEQDWRENPIPCDEERGWEELFMEMKPKEMGEKEATVVLSLIRSILKFDPKERPSASELLHHPWFTSDEFP